MTSKNSPASPDIKRSHASRDNIYHGLAAEMIAANAEPLGDWGQSRNYWEIGVRVEIIGALGQVFLTSKIFHSQTLYSHLLHFSGHHAMNLFA
ncbi:hypothetical protein [Candidatus Spongiihabitans sp.]|uniref:hypothetical protein n=1 Tax=Candidatus Spongiihabitans sp. TaxID=3101308 RepID=UPI003C79C3E9